MSSAIQSPIHSDSLADVLERVLDKGVVIAGDVVVSLVGIELLSIKLRLLITTVDKAAELGVNWWESDPALSSQAGALEAENHALKERLAALEAQMAALSAGAAPAIAAASAAAPTAGALPAPNVGARPRRRKRSADPA